MLLLGLSACTRAEKPKPPAIPLSGLNTAPLAPEKAKDLASQMGKQWFYGEGVGNTAATVGTIVFFPPYAALVLGNAALSMGGYEQYWLSDVLPEEERTEYRQIYRDVTSLPGRTHAAIAGREFITEEEAAKENERFLEANQAK